MMYFAGQPATNNYYMTSLVTAINKTLGLCCNNFSCLYKCIAPRSTKLWACVVIIFPVCISALAEGMLFNAHVFDLFCMGIRVRHLELDHEAIRMLSPV